MVNVEKVCPSLLVIRPEQTKENWWYDVAKNSIHVEHL